MFWRWPVSVSCVSESVRTLISGLTSCCLHIDSEPWNLATPHCPIVSPATDADSSLSCWNHVAYIMRGQTSCIICRCYILWWMFNSCLRPFLWMHFLSWLNKGNCKPQSLRVTAALLFVISVTKHRLTYCQIAVIIIGNGCSFRFYAFV